MERFRLHWQFYLPACLALFLGVPGSLSLFNLPRYTGPAAFEHMESVLLVLVTFAVCAWLLISSIRIEAKLIVGVCFYCFVLYLAFMRVRDGFVQMETLAYFDHLFELTFLRGWLLFLILFVGLCSLDRVKRSPITLASTALLCILFGGLNYQGMKSYETLDAMIGRDVEDRILVGDYAEPQELETQCGRISADEAKNLCVKNVRQAFEFSPCYNAEEDDGFGIRSCFQDLAKSKGLVSPTVIPSLPYNAEIW